MLPTHPPYIQVCRLPRGSGQAKILGRGADAEGHRGEGGYGVVWDGGLGNPSVGLSSTRRTAGYAEHGRWHACSSPRCGHPICVGTVIREHAGLARKGLDGRGHDRHCSAGRGPGAMRWQPLDSGHDLAPRMGWARGAPLTRLVMAWRGPGTGRLAVSGSTVERFTRH
jgi:hypothetical protein